MCSLQNTEVVCFSLRKNRRVSSLRLTHQLQLFLLSSPPRSAAIDQTHKHKHHGVLTVRCKRNEMRWAGDPSIKAPLSPSLHQGAHLPVSQSVSQLDWKLLKTTLSEEDRQTDKQARQLSGLPLCDHSPASSRRFIHYLVKKKAFIQPQAEWNLLRRAAQYLHSGQKPL